MTLPASLSSRPTTTGMMPTSTSTEPRMEECPRSMVHTSEIGNPDLSFTNDTAGIIVIQAYDDGNDAYVHIYGTPDGRVSTLDGPYFRDSAPEGFLVDGRELKKNEIGWSQQVVYADGRVVQNAIVSTYKALPRSIVTKYTEQQKQQQSVAMQ